ncbi:MAG: hypothetical protein HYY20_14180, partial [Candidatus Tectomicrobia bacterium]|nr:hypothetical protein [Candidatus Tectomicrobia bacterium]
DKIVKNARLALERMKDRDVRAAAESIARERVEDAMRKAGKMPGG